MVVCVLQSLLVLVVVMVLCVLQSLLVLVVVMVVCVLQSLLVLVVVMVVYVCVCVAVPAGSPSSRQDAEHLHPEGTFTRVPLRLISSRVEKSLFLNFLLFL